MHELRIDRAHRDDPGGPSRWPWVLGGIIVLAIVAAGIAWLLLARRPIEVQAATAIAPTAGSVNSAVLQATGYVTARREATVSAQITGTLTDVLIEEGEHVKEGQVLAHLEDTAQQANLALADAQLASARAQVGQFQAQLDQARRDLVRQQDLVARKLVSRQAVEQARTQVATFSSQLKSQQRQVQLAQAQVQGAKVQMNYTTVRAPFSGVIIAKAAQVGEIVSPLSAGGGFTRTGIGTIVDMDSLEVEVDVNEAYINRVHPKQPAEAVLDAYPNWTIPAHVIAIIPTADRSKATVKVRVALDQKDARVLPDMGVRVSFLEQAPKGPVQQPKGVLVPASAVVQRNGQSVVFVINGATAKVHPIKPGETRGDLRLVEGLADGTVVVDKPPADIVDGSRIEVTAKSK
ncbi:MAG: efflux RND transporter periplasmic adaptor subunit [Rhodanobacteraceae bacterium]